jgi:hypothetical protein
MKIFWNWLVLFVPLSLSANLVTLIGFLVNSATTAILIAYNPTFSQTTEVCRIAVRSDVGPAQ